MRQLSDKELDQVKRAIAGKDLTSAEILIEIYDHYVSHLEGFEEVDFDGELFELEQKFTPKYSKKLQLDFYENAEKEITRLQWSIAKSYFTWPRAVWTVLLFSIFIFFWLNGGNISKILVLGFPFMAELSLNGWLWYKSYKKVSDIRKLLKSHTTLQSSYLPNSVNQFVMMFLTMNMVIFTIPTFVGLLDSMGSFLFLIAAFLVFAAFIAHMLTYYEACKIKSKTALI
jgi:hypothetical protein